MPVALSTAHSPPKRTRTFLKVMAALFPRVKRINRGSSKLAEFVEEAVVNNYTRVGIIKSRKGNPSVIEFWEYEDGYIFEAPFLVRLDSISLPGDYLNPKPAPLIKALAYQPHESIPTEIHQFIIDYLGPFKEQARYHLMIYPLEEKRKQSGTSPRFKERESRQQEESESFSSEPSPRRGPTRAEMQIYDEKNDEFLLFRVKLTFIPRERRVAKWA